MWPHYGPMHGPMQPPANPRRCWAPLFLAAFVDRLTSPAPGLLAALAAPGAMALQPLTTGRPNRSRFGREALGHGRPNPRRLAKRRRAPGRLRAWLGDAPSSRSPLRGPALAERFRLPTRQRPPAEIAAAVGDAFRRNQSVAVERPAVPLGFECPQVAQAEQPQQLDRRPRHPMRAAIPCAHARQRAPEQIGARLATQQAAAAQLAKPIGRQPPDPATGGRV